MEFAGIILAMLLFSPASAETDWEVAMVTAVVGAGASRNPSTVIATLCWPPHKMVDLHKALTTGEDHQKTMLQIQNPGQISARFSQPQHVVFVVDFGCDNIAEHIKLSNDKKHIKSPFRWILIAGFNNDTHNLIPEAVQNIEVFPDTEVLVARQTTHGSYDLYYIYKVNNETPWRIDQFGSWSMSNGLQKIKEFIEVTALRRINLHGHQISGSIVVLHNDSINHLSDGLDDHIDTITKVNYPTVNHLVEYLNATRNYLSVNTWGYKVNGSWTGMSGHFERGEVDFGVTPMFYIHQRMSLVEYISCPTETRLMFVFIQPKLSYTQNLYLLSFSRPVWYCLFALMFLMFLALFAVAKWEWIRIYDDKTGPSPRTLRGNIQDVAIFTIGAICQQGSPVEMKGVLGRVVTLVLFVTLMFFYTSYSANIVALLQSSSSQINTLEDLLNSRLKVAVQDIVYSKHYFSVGAFMIWFFFIINFKELNFIIMIPILKSFTLVGGVLSFLLHDTVYNKHNFSTAKDRVRKGIYETKVAPPGVKPRFMSMEDGVKNIRKGLFAFHMEVGVGYKFVNRYFEEGEKCGLQEIKYLQTQSPWQAVRKYTPYKEMYKIGTKRIIEAGLQSRENQRLYEKQPKCAGRESNFISVGLVDCYPALLVLAYGVLLSVFVLFVEVILKERRRISNRVCGRF